MHAVGAHHEVIAVGLGATEADLDRRPSRVDTSHRAAKIRGIASGARVMKDATMRARRIGGCAFANPRLAPLSSSSGDPWSTGFIASRSS